jgi:hypothetical protein
VAASRATPRLTAEAGIATSRAIPSHGANANLSIALEEPVEIVGVRREDDRRRSVAKGGRGDQGIDPVVGRSEVAESSGATSGRLVGRLEHCRGALKHAEYAIDLCVASPVARRALDEDRRGNADRAVVLDDPAQPLSGALRATDERRKAAAVENASRRVDPGALRWAAALHRARKMRRASRAISARTA